MVKGVSRQVLELSAPPSVYFERVLFFVKPEYSAASEGVLRERAQYIAQSAGLPPALRLKKSKRRVVLAVIGAALLGMLLGAVAVIFVLTR
ncbi:MAG: hypothetical protein LBJ12_02010 [Oscillospiraceae bacterium]|jgi:hypothetical protein|nr:hypothetical protein [Oscillospiraceae bacterium]